MSEIKSEYSLLYVEDDKAVRENYVTYLKRFYQIIYEASNAEDAYQIFKNKKPDILVIDINLPGKSGIEFLRDVRSFDHSVKAIMLTAMSDVETLMSASELKLTKYLVKPISRDELKDALGIAVQEIVNYTTYANRIIHIQDELYWDRDKEKLIAEGHEIFLTRKERELLVLLFANVNSVVSSEDIIYELWYDYDSSKMTSLKTLVKTLRKKLPQNFVKNVFGIGYKVEV
ncbi:MAG TPA: response regulator transcription factor [Sulfurimonas autotrophica]|uniref:Response regulator transcription factor n=1 Tax=Sulfurimonas autotrophica TaxID=202747 RepID=A0A7C3C3T2_9BACT|nr:response regulator transcription factor [Sulfurimonas autotrophica]